MTKPLFQSTGVHAVVDGQFGSTGKGVIAAWLAEQALEQKALFGAVVSNAGPNSGHTFYDRGGEKHVLKQLPTFAVAMALDGRQLPLVYLTAGAIIDPEILRAEAEKYPTLTVIVHPRAAVITDEDKHSEADLTGTIAAVAGTRSGTGMALARKVMRDPTAVFSAHFDYLRLPINVMMGEYRDAVYHNQRVFMEVSQGFSLGLNSEFYPKVTSRECTVMQGMSDAQIPPNRIANVFLSIRTYPIRVGNVDGFSSGEVYNDQHETSWEKLGVEPELTTVTKRVRRVFTFSYEQYTDAQYSNGAEFVFVNFLNYLPEEDRREFMSRLKSWSLQGTQFITSTGPKSSDVRRA